jgi:glycosyltransferase involved in cell wall biosynthesis
MAARFLKTPETADLMPMPDMAAQSSKRNSLLDPRLTSRRLEVLHVGKFYPPHMGGIETHLEALCGELQKSVDVRVIVANDNRSLAEETLDSIPVTRVPTWLTLASTPLAPAMVARLRAYSGDILHLHFPNPMAVLAYLGSGYRGPVVVTYHSDMVRQKILGPLFEPLLHAALRRSSAIITTSPNYLNTSRVLARHRDRCHIIPLGTPIESFEHGDPRRVAAVREQYGDRLIVSVGRLVYYKGFEYLIRAMAKVSGHLLIVGQGPLRSKLSALASELGVADRVHLLGKIDHESLVACYHAAQVFVMASVARSEAFGIAQIEAMAAGLPVVNTSLDSGVPFVSLHQQTGLTVPPADSERLASAINCLLDNPELRNTYARAARLRAKQEFAVEVMAERTLSLYERIAMRLPPAGV